MENTKIDWCDSSWNPVTGCLHGCPYCYARKMANRFSGGGYGKQIGMFIAKYNDDAFKPPYDLHEPILKRTNNGTYPDAPYPFGFDPTFHRYRLNDYLTKKAQVIFVCSMADLFGTWVPDSWIKEVFEACHKATQHTYLFLTKNPSGIDEAIEDHGDRGCEESLEYFKDFWFGTSVTCDSDRPLADQLSAIEEGHRFLSIEPLLGPVTLGLEKDRCPACGSGEVYGDNPNTCGDNESWYCDCCGEWESNDQEGLRPSIEWIIIGAESGNRKDKVIPERWWIDGIVEQAREVGVPVFMKSSLIPIMGEENMLREFPSQISLAKGPEAANE